MSISTIKIDFTSLNESETKEVLSYIKEYEDTCEKEIRAMENTAIVSNTVRTVAAGAVGAFALSAIDKAIKNENASRLEKSILITAGLIEMGLCTVMTIDNIGKVTKVLVDRKKRTARTNILNADTKAELGISKILLKKQEEENVKNKKK